MAADTAGFEVWRPLLMSAIAKSAACVALLFITPSIYAATYKCTSGGSTSISDRPCSDPNKTQLGMYGPARTAPVNPYASQLPPAPKAQDHVQYLPSGCASIQEAIRTAPARGVRSDVVNGLREEYNQKCAVEDRDARNQANQEKAQQQQVKLAERDASARERQQAKLKADRCSSMREVIALKRKRESTLNPVEVTALRDLERSYNEQCLAR